MSFKITYSAKSADAQKIDEAYDKAVASVKKILGKEFKAVLGFKELAIERSGFADNTNPADTRIIVSKHAI